MPRQYRFVQVDVFTGRLFGGNPLAVVLEPSGLADAEMQAIAHEMNLSETTFVFRPTRADCAARVRIFTPVRELPFAGHPTLATAWGMAVDKRVPLRAGPARVKAPAHAPGPSAPGPVRLRDPHPALRRGPQSTFEVDVLACPPVRRLIGGRLPESSMVCQRGQLPAAKIGWSPTIMPPFVRYRADHVEGQRP